MGNRTCSINDETCGTGNGPLQRGWCGKHYKRWLKYGDPLGQPELTATPPAFPHHGEAEEWRHIAGYEGLYMVSSLARIWSVPRMTASGRRGGQILKPTWSDTDGRGHGYLGVKLQRNGVSTHAYVHSLVAAAFLGPRQPGEQVRHGPNGELDNRASELCYGTPRENGADAVRDGTTRRGTRGTFAKLTDADVIEIRRQRAAGDLQGVIAARYGVTPSSVSMIVNGKTWRHLLPAAPPIQTTLF